MSDIERAIQEFEDNAYHTSMKPTISEASKAVALRILRAELSRQENAPLTEGELSEMVDKPIFIVFESPIDTIITRKWSIPYMVENGTAHCTDGENWYPAPNCHIYRYEPKGEKE